MQFKYQIDDVLVGLNTLKISTTLKLDFEKVMIRIIGKDHDLNSYKLKVITTSEDINDFIFILKRELIEDEKIFVPLEKYRKYKTHGDTIMIKTPNNELKEYTIEEISSNNRFDTYITLKLKSCD